MAGIRLISRLLKCLVEKAETIRDIQLSNVTYDKRGTHEGFI